jgi:hypothetical protein
MSENSAFWDGIAVGDAASGTGWKAKYSSSNMSDILSKVLSNDSISGYVVPEYEDELMVQSSTPYSMNVVVGVGKALVSGRIYANTANKTLALAPNVSGQARLDRVVLQVAIAPQTCRLIILEGTPGAPPVLPTLTQDANIFEVPLAYVWVPAAAANVVDADIHDERYFLQTFSTLNKYAGADTEICNSEYMITDRLAAAGPKYYYYPTNWIGDTKTEAIYSAAPSQMTRGRAITLTAITTSTTGIYQDFPIKASTHYAIKVLVKVAIGSVGYITVTTNSSSPVTITKTIRRTNLWIEETIYYTSEYDSSNMTIAFYLPAVNGQVMYAGQVLAVEGYHPGPFRPIHETILCSSEMAFHIDLPGSHSSSTDTEDWSTVFPGAKSLFLRSSADDTLDTTGAFYKQYGGTDVWVGCVGGRSHNNGEIALIDNKYDVEYVASGVNTISAYLYIDGIQT